MSHYADPHDHAHDHEQPQLVSPVPERWIPWVVIGMAAALIVIAFTIPIGFLPR
jgi:hypothetical protein